MEFELVNLELLNDVTNNIKNLAYKESYYLRLAIHSMYTAGLRSSEASDISKHRFLTEHTVNIYQSKSKSFRQIPAIFFSSEYLELIANPNRVSVLVTERQLRHFVKINLGNWEYQVKNKHISTHLFRYAFIRNLKDAGTETIDIQNIVGHSNIELTNTYLTNDILRFRA